MATITEDYVSFETAKLLKEKGFNIPCDNYYDSSGKTPNESVYGGANIETLDYNADPFVKSGFPKFKTFSVPTQAMAMKWLREVHKLVIVVSICNENNKGNTDYSNPDRWFYFFDITNAKGVVIDTEYDPLSNEFPTYEQACEAAIKYCLVNLI